MDRIIVSDLTMTGVGAPIFLRLGNRARPFREGMATPAIGSMKNITISNIEATGANPMGCAIAGLPEARIENVTLSNIRFSFVGGGTTDQAARPIPEEVEKYPEYAMFGKLPAYGLYCRHVDGLKLANIQLQLAGADKRHALVLDDVRNATLDGLDAAWSNGAASSLRLTDVHDVWIRGCRPAPGMDAFLKVQGAKTEGVTLMGNDLRGVKKVIEADEGVPTTAVAQIANRTE
jgi:hypothetical protein